MNRIHDKNNFYENSNSDKEQFELYLKIAFGIEESKHFDADHLCHIIYCWEKCKYETTLTKSQIDEIEQLFICRVSEGN